MIEKSLISILMPVKNPGKYLIPSIESILAQTEKSWEFIAVDDHSTDDSLKTLQDFAEKDLRIHVLKNKGEGIIHALRTAYEACNGEYIHRMDSDDIMPVNKLELLLEKCKKGTVATGPVEYFSDDWLVGLGFQNYRDWLNENMKSGSIWTDLYMECPIPSPAWMIHREDLNRIGAFHSDLIPEDYDLCFRIYESGLKVAVCNEVVHRWRDSQERTSRKNPDYFPMAYYPLKVHYFLKLEKEEDDLLFLWGAGKKGKLIAQILLEHGVKFQWVTDNKNKIGQDIHGVIIEEVDFKQQIKAKTIIAVASPDDKAEIQELLNLNGFDKNKHYWWFC